MLCSAARALSLCVCVRSRPKPVGVTRALPIGPSASSYPPPSEPLQLDTYAGEEGVGTRMHMPAIDTFAELAEEVPTVLALH